MWGIAKRHLFAAEAMKVLLKHMLEQSMEINTKLLAKKAYEIADDMDEEARYDHATEGE